MDGKSPFLTTQWRHLAMLNYEVDPDLLRNYIPPGTELDFHDGTTFLSIVGFLFEDTRLLGIPIPFHQKFEEVNLRFYVRRQAEDGWRRGVCFLQEIVSKPAVSFIARKVYDERYVTLPMKHRIEPGIVEYGWKTEERWNTLQVKITGTPKPLVPRSREEFIAEHYWGYTLTRGGECLEYQVDHPSWNIWQSAGAGLNCDVKAVYGPRFVDTLSRQPVSSFVADGSAVSVFRGVGVQTV